VTEKPFTSSVWNLATGMLQYNEHHHLLQILMSAQKDQESAVMASAITSKEASSVFVRMATS
jgi:hypothetical protein